MTGIEPGAVTDAHGRFLLTSVPVGLNGVYAQKPESGYPDTTGAIYLDDSALPPKVSVRSGEVASGVVVRLGKKAGLVLGEVVDEDTLQPVVTARVKLSLPENERIMISMTTDRDGRFRLLLPARPVRFAVYAPGYNAWQFAGSQEPAGVIYLGSEERKELTIKLHSEKR